MYVIGLEAKSAVTDPATKVVRRRGCGRDGAAAAATLEMRAWERRGEKFMLDVAKVRWVVREKERPMACGEQGVLRRMGRRSMMAVGVCF